MKQHFIALFLCLLVADVFAQQLDATLYVDFHSHSVLKPFYARNAQKKYSIWERVEHDCDPSVLELTKPLGERRLYRSQSNLSNALKGNNRLSCQVLYPLERNFFRSSFYTTENIVPFITCLWGFEMNARLIMDTEHDYFRELIYQMRFLINQQELTETIAGRPYSFKLLKSGKEVDAVLRLPNIMGGILAVEGGHSLSAARYLDSLVVDPEGFEREVMANVNRLKGLRSLVDGVDYQLDVPVFYIRLANAFANGLVGQSLQLLPEFTASYGMPQQLNTGFTPLGQKVVHRLLDKTAGYRILVDVGGMSVASRKWYYQKVHNYHYHGDTIPIIATNVGISGLSWKEKPFRLEDEASKNKDQWLNHYQRNLGKEDIKAIVNSKGLIGLSSDLNILAGPRFTEQLSTMIPRSATTRELMIKVLVANMCEVIYTAQRREAWDVIAIGSNFDGFSQVMDYYDESEDFSDLAKDLEAFFANPKDIGDLFTAHQIQQFMYDYTAEELVRKIMSENALRVLRENLGVGFEEPEAGAAKGGVKIKSN